MTGGRCAPINHSSSSLWRVIYVACSVAVFSFIFFDVLDLDGSRFPLQPYPIQSDILAPAGPEETEHVYLPRLVEHWNQIITIPLTGQFGVASLYRTEEFRFFISHGVRDRGYRAALPRSSTADPSLPA